MTTDTTPAAIGADALREAERLLRESAQEYMEGVSINGVPDWENEPETEAAYKEHIAAADGLAALASAAQPPEPECEYPPLPEPAAWMLACQTMGGDVAWILSWTQSGAGLCDRLPGEAHEKPLYTHPARQAVPVAPQEDALDAERYRWIRDPCSGAEHHIYYSRGDYGKGLMSGPMLDDAIDAARANEGASNAN